MASLLVSWNGISVFLDNVSTTAADLELCTDASSHVGYGGYFKTHWFAAAWSDDLQMLFSVEDDFSMAFRELYPIVVAAIIWGAEWTGKRIIFTCDNMATVNILQKG